MYILIFKNKHFLAWLNDLKQLKFLLVLLLITFIIYLFYFIFKIPLMNLFNSDINLLNLELSSSIWDNNIKPDENLELNQSIEQVSKVSYIDIDIVRWALTLTSISIIAYLIYLKLNNLHEPWIQEWLIQEDFNFFDDWELIITELWSVSDKFFISSLAGINDLLPSLNNTPVTDVVETITTLNNTPTTEIVETITNSNPVWYDKIYDETMSRLNKQFMFKEMPEPSVRIFKNLTTAILNRIKNGDTIPDIVGDTVLEALKNRAMLIIFNTIIDHENEIPTNLWD